MHMKDNEIKKGDTVYFRGYKAKVIGISSKGGNEKYKLKVKDGFDTVVYNVDKKDVRLYIRLEL